MMKKNRKQKKNWTFLQIQLPRHHLIQSEAFAFCLPAVFREPVNKKKSDVVSCSLLFAAFYSKNLNFPPLAS